MYQISKCPVYLKYKLPNINKVININTNYIDTININANHTNTNIANLFLARTRSIRRIRIIQTCQVLRIINNLVLNFIYQLVQVIQIGHQLVGNRDLPRHKTNIFLGRRTYITNNSRTTTSGRTITMTRTRLILNVSRVSNNLGHIERIHFLSRAIAARRIRNGLLGLINQRRTLTPQVLNSRRKTRSQLRGARVFLSLLITRRNSRASRLLRIMTFLSNLTRNFNNVRIISTVRGSNQ